MRRLMVAMLGAAISLSGFSSFAAEPVAPADAQSALRKELSDLMRQREELREAFAFIDVNRDGRIEFVEFSQLLASQRRHMTEDQRRNAFESIDGDRDGCITFDELAAWYVL